MLIYYDEWPTLSVFCIFQYGRWRLDNISKRGAVNT